VPPAILIRDIAGLAETQAVEGLQAEVWGMNDRDLTPATHLVAVKEAGGQLIGAFDGQALVGFIYGFLGLEHGRTVHHSHLLAVRPAYRNLEIGYRLKLAQRAAVLAQGIERMTWTFDPLQSANAHFNFGKLGATSDSYRINFYGEETSSFLHRFGTDRLWLTWHLDSRRVLRRLQEKTPVASPECRMPALVRLADDGSPVDRELDAGLAAEQALIEIPDDINALGREHPERAVEWREVTRRAFGAALAAGFLVEDFCRGARADQPFGAYVLRRGRQAEELP
jgi:predicted GNAT superfamily acetyltransferase